MPFFRQRGSTLLLAALLLPAAAIISLTGVSRADSPPPSRPAPLPMPAAIPAPQDVAFPGTIHLAVDATDLDRRIFAAHERVPVPDALSASGGTMTLLYPRWLPGDHGPSGPIDQFGGLTVQAGGKPLDWRRDVVDVYAFHVGVPKGARFLDLSFQLLSPVGPREGRVLMTPDMLNLQWNTVLLYPAGYFSRGITVAARMVIPEGWQYGTALRPGKAGRDDAVRENAVSFAPVALNTLVDSPVFAGRYFRRIDITPQGGGHQDGTGTPVFLDLMADAPAQLAATAPQIEAHRSLVRQANLLFGSRHYAQYDFLLALTDQLGGIGLEHHQSSENSGPHGYFTDWDATAWTRDLLAHEFTHSWNGKFRRPADLWTPNFNVPERDSLLWVYEGQTQYWGYVLAARSGLMTRPQVLDALAAVAAKYDNQAGRSWRSVADTTNDPIIADRAPLSWPDWQRSEDYYSEGQLIWLDADTLIRQLSGGRRSLDDVARRFFGIKDGDTGVVTYGFDDVVAALNAVQPYDWAGFLHRRIEGHGNPSPLDGFLRGGYRLVYTDQPNPRLKQDTEMRPMRDQSYSLGLLLKPDGKVLQVQWGSPAYKAGIAAGTQLLAVNGESYADSDERDLLAEAITAARPADAAPIALLVQDGRRYRELRIPYHGGLRYPHLERVPGTPALLDAILTPRP